MRSDQSYWYTNRKLPHKCPVDGDKYMTALPVFTDGRDCYVHCDTCKTTWNARTEDEAGWTVEKKED